MLLPCTQCKLRDTPGLLRSNGNTLTAVVHDVSALHHCLCLILPNSTAREKITMHTSCTQALLT